MGLFSSKKKIFVSSSLYNLAGDIDKRVNYLKTVVGSHIITHGEGTVGEAVTGSLLRGPGIKFRSFARWARTQGYSDHIGLEPGDIAIGSNINLDSIALKLPHTLEQQVAIQTAEIDRAEYGFWADRWMLENHPDEVTQDYEIDFDEPTNTIYIAFVDGSKTYTFNPVNFDPLARYLYVSYMLIEKNVAQPWEEGATIIVDSPSEWPDTSDWELENTVNTPRTFNCVDTVQTVVTYSDGRPAESSTTTTPHTDGYTDVANAYGRAVFQGTNPEKTGTSSLVYRTTKTTFGAIDSSTSTSSTDETIAGGVIKTTTVTTTLQFVGPRYSYAEDMRIVFNDTWSDMKVLIYKQGDGDAEYDAMFAAQTNVGTFMPFIPMRYYNRMVNEVNYPADYEWNVRATKKGLNAKYDTIMKQLADNPSIGDVDFAYIVFGVPLNTPDKSARKYIFRFFQMLNSHGGGGSAEYDAWRSAWSLADATQKAWLQWQEAQSNPLSPLYGSPEPARAIYPEKPQRRIRVKGSKWNYQLTLTWTSITEVVGAGQAKPGARSGDCWFDTTSAEQFDELLISAGLSGDRTYESNTVFMYWQETANTYRALGVTGLWHNYMIYGGKGVDIHGDEAMRDEDESGFIIPIHEEIYRDISLTAATQMATSCTYMLLNSYKVVKQKWYTKSWFKIALIVVAVVVTVVTAGAGSPVGAGLTAITSATTVGAAAAAVATLIASLAINAVVASLLIKMLTPIATSIFGEEFGALVAVVASVAIMSMGASMASGGTASDGLASMTSAPELLKMTSATMDNYNRVQQADLLQVQKQIQELQKNYQKELAVIHQATLENLGPSNGVMDWSQVTSSITAQYENMDTFLGRTLMLGSDICQMTNNLIGAFAAVTTTTELPV